VLLLGVACYRAILVRPRIGRSRLLAVRHRAALAHTKEERGNQAISSASIFRQPTTILSAYPISAWPTIANGLESLLSDARVRDSRTLSLGRARTLGRRVCVDGVLLSGFTSVASVRVRRLTHGLEFTLELFFV
jgi:hypothetical protein